MSRTDFFILSDLVKAGSVRVGSVIVGFASAGAMLLALLLLLLNFSQDHSWLIRAYIWLGPPALLAAVVLAFIDTLEGDGRWFASAALILLVWYVGGIMGRLQFAGFGT